VFVDVVVNEGVIPSVRQVFLISEITDVDVPELSQHHRGIRRSRLPVLGVPKQHTTNKVIQNKTSSKEEEQSGKFPNLVQNDSNDESLSSSAVHMQLNANGQIDGIEHEQENKGIDLSNKDQAQQTQQKLSLEQQNYQNTFSKISNNFEKHNTHKNQQNNTNT
ncbi:hypothetical protein H5410_040893, partial [Solanum commersonii]